MLVIASGAFATPIDQLTFTYNCTVNGTGTNNCAEGDTVAEVRLTAEDSDGDGVMDLYVDARWLDSDDTLPATNADYNLNTIWLNVIETGGLLGSSGELQWTDNGGTNNDYNWLLFSFDDSMNSEGDNRTVRIQDDQVDDSNYKGFDTQLCGATNPDSGFGGNDSCGDINLVTDPIEAWVSVGYLFSGNDFDLYSGIFDAVTENSEAIPNPDEVFFGDECGSVPESLSSMIQIDPATSGTNDQVCGGGGYGPRYGAYSTTSVPEPDTLLLLGVGLLGLGLSRRFKKTW